MLLVVLVGLVRLAAGLQLSRLPFDLNSPRCPLEVEGQQKTAREAIIRAVDAGVTRQLVRTLLPRGESRELTPLDETWIGGIMQLYRECSPAARNLLKAVGEARDTSERPFVSVREQRIDASGVDGESLVVAESRSSPLLDSSCFVMPSVETEAAIVAGATAAGPRLVLLLNPQFRDTEDTLDFLASKVGFLGQLGGFLGGKAKLTQILAELGFEDTFSLQEVVVAGTRVRYFLAFPYAWQIYALADGDEPPIRLGEDTKRPDYNKIAAVLEANQIRPKLLRDAGQASPLTAASIRTFYTADDGADEERR